MNQTCPKCGQNLLEAKLAESVTMIVASRESSSLGEGTLFTPMICPACGYTEFYAKNPERLK